MRPPLEAEKNSCACIYNEKLIQNNFVCICICYETQNYKIISKIIFLSVMPFGRPASKDKEDLRQRGWALDLLKPLV